MGRHRGVKLTMHECQYITRDRAFENPGHRLGRRVGALRGALLADLQVARGVARSQVGTTYGFPNGAVFKYKIPEQPGLTVVAIWAKPFLPKMQEWVQFANDV